MSGKLLIVANESRRRARFTFHSREKEDEECEYSGFDTRGKPGGDSRRARDVLEEAATGAEERRDQVRRDSDRGTGRHRSHQNAVEWGGTDVVEAAHERGMMRRRNESLRGAALGADHALTRTLQLASTVRSSEGASHVSPHLDSHVSDKPCPDTSISTNDRYYALEDDGDDVSDNDLLALKEGYAAWATSRKRNKSEPDSHNYEPDESEVWRMHQAQRHFRDRGRWWTTNKRRAAKRWAMTLVVGMATGLIAVFVTFCTKAFTELKFRPVYNLLHEYGGPSFTAFGTMLGFNLTYVVIANLLMCLEPIAAGSGIPEIKAFLNGIDLPRVVRVKTLLCKVLGVLFSVAAGLPAGKEGPMVHSGAVVAAGISQGKSNVLGFDTSFSKFQDFRNDREKRDFVACGAAAGVAAAFGAPIGGVLFSLEEGASFWSTKLTWRAFFCAMMTVFTLYAVKSTQNLWGQQDLYEMFSFGEFNELEAGQGNFSVWELWLFILIGCMGGLIGACFNRANQRISVWRRQHVRRPFMKLLEVIVVTVVMTGVSFLMPILWNKCTEKPVDMEDWTEQERTLVDQLVAFNCNPETQYNEVASLFFRDSDTAIRQLFHFRETGSRNNPTFSSGALFVFFVPYCVMACITYGIAVPSGLFVPSLLSGAAFGRLCGHLLHKLDGTSGTFADSGTYALVGAAACLGGMARMTISLTVILLEATGDMQYVLPLMLTLMAARWVGNVFNEGLYEMQIHLSRLPFLEDEVPSVASRNDMTASQAMSRHVRCLRPLERAGAVYDTLVSCEHDCFPVVDDQVGDILVGTILRKCLTIVLHEKAFGPEDAMRSGRAEMVAGAGGAHGRISPLISWGAMERIYPRYPTIGSVRLTEEERRGWIDLRPYVNTAPYVINESASLMRTYRLFRILGLRHLCVVNHHNQVVGIVTRKDLLPEHLAQRLAEVPRTRVWDPPLVRHEAARSYSNEDTI